MFFYPIKGRTKETSLINSVVIDVCAKKSHEAARFHLGWLLLHYKYNIELAWKVYHQFQQKYSPQRLLR